jgi:hypothetical protein
MRGNRALLGLIPRDTIWQLKRVREGAIVVTLLALNTGAGPEELCQILHVVHTPYESSNSTIPETLPESIS